MIQYSNCLHGIYILALVGNLERKASRSTCENWPSVLPVLHRAFCKVFIPKRSLNLRVLPGCPGPPVYAAKPNDCILSFTSLLTDKSSSSHSHTNHWGFCLFLDVSHIQILSGDFSSLKRFANIIIIIFAHKLKFFFFGLFENCSD